MSVWQGHKIQKRTHLQFSPHMQCFCQQTTACTGCPPECLAGERYNNTEYAIIYLSPFMETIHSHLALKKNSQKQIAQKSSLQFVQLNKINRHPEASTMGPEDQKSDTHVRTDTLRSGSVLKMVSTQPCGRTVCLLGLWRPQASLANIWTQKTKQQKNTVATSVNVNSFKGFRVLQCGT